ncbi:ABA4-like family protein [Croceitalea sp. MTPC5]|uniref:ABA4-like family protein n=1 Tax=Croceitalea sp. MTPC5 TaxID=3056565 RepID=UPI002B387844|nr:ABA4-like family protein [Croceitalea sp. MTPC5]
MTPSEIFSTANMTAMPMWLLLMALPKWKVTRFLIDYKIVPLLLAILYVVFIVRAIQIGGWMDFGSLDSVMALFTEENAVLAGWIHYLAFDLLVGMWMVNQNAKLKIHRLLMVPCLLGTFMFGPVGFALFIILKTIKKQQS